MSAVDLLAIWAIGIGYETDIKTQVILNNLVGWGEDSFESICFNLIIQKKIFGNAFAEIVRDRETGALVNLKPLWTGDMRVFVDENGLIDHYEQHSGGAIKSFKPEQIFCLVNDRIANEIHGQSIIDSVHWVIDARNEAMSDWRRISHRSTIRGRTKS